MFKSMDLATTLPLNLVATVPLKARYGLSRGKREQGCRQRLQVAVNPAAVGQRLLSSSGSAFLILDELGVGGQGVVYRAFSEKENKVVAIKLPSMRNKAEASNLLSSEARNLARLNHPNIVKAIEYGSLTDGRAYLVMDYIQAESLDCLIKRCGQLPQKRAVTICLQIADAIEHAHQRGVVHRDLKPRNILVANVDGKDFVTVLDFGISFLPDETIPCSEEHTYGSVFYLSPEQIKDEEISLSSDIYQLGLIFFECLLGHLPFRPTFTAAIAYRLGGKILSPNALCQLTPFATAILRMSLARNPNYRQSSMGQMALQLKELLSVDSKSQFVMSNNAA